MMIECHWNVTLHNNNIIAISVKPVKECMELVLKLLIHVPFLDDKDHACTQQWS